MILLFPDLPSPPCNLTIKRENESPHMVLLWEFKDSNSSSADFVYFTVYCSNIQPHSSLKTKLSIQTKDNNAMLVGLSLNTTYTCCVSAVFPYMETESTCINITTGEHLPFILSYTTVIHISQTLS